MSAKKTGRNDPCHCGSKKKYKKCCLNNDSLSKRTSPSHPLGKFNKKFLLDWFCTALLLPENHGKNIRLELLVREALLFGQENNGSTNKVELIEVLDKHYSRNHLEDDPENLFTEIITFYGGDYLVSPGISDNGIFALRTVLDGIFHDSADLPKTFQAVVGDACILILSMSNYCLEQAGLKRYAEGVRTESAIYLAEKICHEAFFITDEHLKSLVSGFNKKTEVVTLFCLSSEDNLADPDPNRNVIIGKPILKENDGYRILSVSNLHVALLHFIWESAIHFKCIESVIKIFVNIVWNNIQFHLKKSDYRKITETLNLVSPSDFIHDVFRFDLDKIAYVLFNYDDADGYDTGHPYYSSCNMVNADFDHTVSESISRIKSAYPNDQILLFRFSAGIGREYRAMYKPVPDIIDVNLSASDFEILMKRRDYDSLSLWNFALAKAKFTSKVNLIMTGDFDLYVLYKKHKDSFYLNDKRLPDMMFLEPGTSAEFTRDVTISEDIHSIRRINSALQIGYTPCLKIKGSKNIYYSLSDIGSTLRQVIEGYVEPIWVEFSGDLSQINQSAVGVYIEFLEALSYWIWQITSSVSGPVNSIISNPFTIYFDFIDRSKFEEIDSTNVRKENLLDDFEYHMKLNGFELKIPDQITTYLYSGDNMGEQLLVRAVLEGFRRYDLENLNTAKITSDLIDRTIANDVPLGLKKKLFVLNTENDIKLDPRGLKKIRYISEFEVGNILDEIVPRAILSGLIKETTKKITDGYGFVRKLVADILLPWIDTELANLDCEDLLTRLILLNEVLINKRTNHILKTPTRIACFVSVDEHVKDLNETLHQIDQASISVRCLIEHIAACPTAGQKRASKSDFDRVLALMEQIIAWGMYGDQINFGLVETHIDILDSKRLGTDHSLGETCFNPFSLARTKESVTDAFANFESNFVENEYSDGEQLPANIDNAFKEEFGVTLTRILEFSHVLINFSFEVNPGCTAVYESELKTRAKELLPTLTDAEFIALMTYFSLDKRDGLMILPTGFMAYDVFPWRYNRGLSLMRKPIIRRFDKTRGENFCVYGPRQVRVVASQILYLFHTGKLRYKEGGN